jgi:hypothetical protein
MLIEILRKTEKTAHELFQNREQFLFDRLIFVAALSAERPVNLIYICRTVECQRSADNHRLVLFVYSYDFFDHVCHNVYSFSVVLFVVLTSDILARKNKQRQSKI